MRVSIWKPVLLATAICGTLDILFAVLLTLWRGREPAAMLRFVASGPFPQAMEWGPSGSVLGLIVHFTLMAIMVAALIFYVRRHRGLADHPMYLGIVYGFITYVVMNLIIVPLRFSAAWPPKPLSIATQLFAHVVLVGLPTAFIARRYLSVRI